MKDFGTHWKNFEETMLICGRDMVSDAVAKNGAMRVTLLQRSEPIPVFVQRLSSGLILKVVVAIRLAAFYMYWVE